MNYRFTVSNKYSTNIVDIQFCSQLAVYNSLIASIQYPQSSLLMLVLVLTGKKRRMFMRVKTMMLSIDIASHLSSPSSVAPDISSSLLLQTISCFSALKDRGGSSEDDITRAP